MSPPAQKTPNVHAAQNNRVWFATKFPDRFSPERIVEVTEAYAREARIKCMPCGAFVFSPETLPLVDGEPKLPVIVPAIVKNTAAPGLLVPTAILGKEWKFDLPLSCGRELLEHLNAITLMVIAKIQHGHQVNEFVGAAQPMYCLAIGAGSCFERASVLAAVFRKNGVPARIVGHPELLSSMHLENRHHWWVEAEIAGVWVPFDPNLGFHAAMMMSPAFAEVSDSFKIRDYLEALGFLEFVRKIGPAFVTEQTFCKPNVSKAMVAPEMDLPEKYRSIVFP